MGNNTTVAEAAKWRKEKATHFASVTAERAIRDLHSERLTIIKYITNTARSFFHRSVKIHEEPKLMIMKAEDEG